MVLRLIQKWCIIIEQFSKEKSAQVMMKRILVFGNCVSFIWVRNVS